MFNSPLLSLSDILGKTYTENVTEALSSLGIMDKRRADALADEKIDFYPKETQKTNDELLERVGTQILHTFQNSNAGAPTDSFSKASNYASSPITGIGTMRVGEDGRLYLIGKSEHYHSSLGHHFNGYRLINNARELGILNATHNNTRGYITRLTERELVRTANGLEKSDTKGLDAVLASKEPKILNRVINLETGSLAVEAGIKMMLARFYRLDMSFDAPKYASKIPVFLIMQDMNGGKEANYHGTTVTAQSFRGLWPEYYDRVEKSGAYKIVPVKINDINDFKIKLQEYNSGEYKTAGFLHEIVLMNYGGVRLDEEYLRQAYKLCTEYDTPTMADEIQSCMWYKGMYLFRLYGLHPDFVVVGKGFPGGEYPASKIITTAEMDTLNQFGALVTNGQEELASLAYLITMAFSEANGDLIEKYGKYFESELREVCGGFPALIDKVEGQGHLLAVHFKTIDTAAGFVKRLGRHCIDTSVQIYKKNCPPAVLLKPPVISSPAVLHYIADNFKNVLKEMS